jgi:hypothetical protein
MHPSSLQGFPKRQWEVASSPEIIEKHPVSEHLLFYKGQGDFPVLQGQSMFKPVHDPHPRKDDMARRILQKVKDDEEGPWLCSSSNRSRMKKEARHIADNLVWKQAHQTLRMMMQDQWDNKLDVD